MPSLDFLIAVIQKFSQRLRIQTDGMGFFGTALLLQYRRRKQEIRGG